jgi:4-amino-4-deoxy-L-arabinose transferase-like glycosyltransferase
LRVCTTARDDGHAGTTPGPTWAWLALILLVAAALRLAQLGSESLWFDEGFAWAWSGQSEGDIWGSSAALEPNPPLYYALLHATMRGIGESEAALRAPSAVAGALTVLLVFAIGRIAFGPAPALIGASLAASSAPLVAYSQEARAYSLLTAGAMLAIWGLLRLLRAHTPGKWWWAPASLRDRPVGVLAYAAGTALAIYAHNTAVLLPVLATLLVVAVWLATDRRPAVAIDGLLASLLALIPCLWWLPTLATQAMGPLPQLEWLAQPGPARALAMTASLYGLNEVPVLRPWSGALPFLPLLAIPALVAGPQRHVARMLALFVVGTPLLTWLSGFLGRPIMIERTLLWPVGLGLLLIAAGTMRLPAAPLRYAACGLAFAAHALNLGLYYALPQKEPWREITQEVLAQRGADDRILVYPTGAAPSFVYYARHEIGMPPPLAIAASQDFSAVLRLSRWGNDRQPAIPVSLADLPARIKGAPRLWLVINRRSAAGRLLAVEETIGRLGRVVGRRDYGPQLTLLEVIRDSIPPG